METRSRRGAPGSRLFGNAFWACGLTVLALASSGCRLSYDEDVSTDPSYKAIYGHCFELKADAFLWRWKDTKKPELSIPGEAVDDLLPATIEDYLRNPTDWHRLPPYDEKFDSPSDVFSEIIAVVPRGSRFTVTKIVMNYHFDGDSLHPQGRLQRPVGGIEEFGLYGLVHDNHHTTLLTYDANLVKPCIAALPPGVKIGEKVAR